jgi:AraC-like DNA-binding protein
LEILFVEVVRHCEERKVKNENSYTQERLEEFLELLQANVSVYKQVADYAEMMHLSSFQINRITKEILGKTCSQVINDQILLEAKRNLLGTSIQINQIALDLGYEHASYFIRFFKKHMGVSPEVFRNNFK